MRQLLAASGGRPARPRHRYFDPDDLSASTEDAIEQRAAHLLGDPEVTLDVKNEARVHLWYAERIGRVIPPYRSTEDAISTWPTTASSIGIRYDDGDFVVCAPFGLADLFAMAVRPNKTIITRTVYEAKVVRWSEIWPKLSIIPW